MLGGARLVLPAGHDPGQVTLTEWVNQWFPALDLEPTTLANDRYAIEVHILPAFGDRPLASLTAEEIAAWEMETVRRGYTRTTARAARTLLATILGDAIPRHIQANPATRRRGKGRRGLNRIARNESAEKAWPTPLQALLVAERCAALSGSDTDFVMVVTIAYTGMRWSEAIGLGPDCVHENMIDINWKLYELNGKFYKGGVYRATRSLDLGPHGHLHTSYHVEEAGLNRLRAVFDVQGNVDVPRLVSIAPTFETWTPMGPGKVNGQFTMVWTGEDGTQVQGKTDSHYVLPTEESIPGQQFREIRINIETTATRLLQTEHIVLFTPAFMEQTLQSAPAPIDSLRDVTVS